MVPEPSCVVFGLDLLHIGDMFCCCSRLDLLLLHGLIRSIGHKGLKLERVDCTACDKKISSCSFSVMYTCPYRLESPSVSNCVHSQQIEPTDRGHV